MHRARQSGAVLENCWSHDNMDDGWSDHYRSETMIVGGLYEYNGKGGITPSYGTHCTCHGVYSRHNYNGFGYAMVATDGGGIVMAHPMDANFDDRCRMLDFDERVLGIEIYNNNYNKDKEGYTALEASEIFCGLWDRLLSSGRRCWGFAVVDWQDPLYSPWHGSNVLLVPAFTEHECLKAYRNGAFYSQIKDSGLKFTNISATDTEYSVSINREATIKFITNRGVVKEVSGTSASCSVDDSDVYMRVEAIETSDETSHIFSNPTMYRKPNDSDARRKEIMRKAVILL